MREWVAFWNTANSIYVNARHRDVHYQLIANDIRTYLPGPHAYILDYGCGEALHADRIAQVAAQLTLCDAAPAMHEILVRRFGGAANIAVRAVDEIEALPDASFDVIVMHSVAQYISAKELDRILALFHRLLRPGCRLVLGDVVPTSRSALADVAALVRFAAANGFLVAALGGLVRTAFSNYRKLRARPGLAVYEEAAILARLTGAGFAAARAPVNIGHNPARMTFVATARPRVAVN